MCDRFKSCIIWPYSFQNIAFRIFTGCLLKYEWNLLKIGFKNTYFLVFPGFPAIPESSQISKFRPNLGQFRPKRAFFEISTKNWKRNNLSTPETMLPMKNLKILMRGSGNKMKNLHFWSFYTKKANFGQFLAKMAKTVKIIKKALGKFFFALTSPKYVYVSEKN